MHQAAKKGHENLYIFTIYCNPYNDSTIYDADFSIRFIKSLNIYEQENRIYILGK